MTIIRPMDDSYFVKQHPIYHPNLVDKMEFYPTKKGMFSQEYLVITGVPRKSPVKTVLNLNKSGLPGFPLKIPNF